MLSDMSISTSETDGRLKQLCRRVRSAGLRVTDARLVVLRCLLTATRPISHKELGDQLAETEIDRATIYRNLVSLAKIGILK